MFNYVSPIGVFDGLPQGEPASCTGLGTLYPDAFQETEVQCV